MMLVMYLYLNYINMYIFAITGPLTLYLQISGLDIL